MGGNSGFFGFFSWACLFLGYKQMLISSMGGLGKKGKKKTSKKGSESCRNLQKFDKSVQKRALLCKKLQKFGIFVF
jgi:hypothetical protein